MYQSSVDQIPSKRGRLRPQSQTQQSHIEDTLMLKPPGILHPIKFPFPDRKLPVCATCKRNYKTRELCRTRDGHTSLPWTTTYICITLDASCVNEKGEFRSDAKLVARPVATHKNYCFTGEQTVEVPICLACKEKNYTRQYCREKLKHRQLPWATAFAVLYNIDKDPSDPKPEKSESKEKATSVEKPLKTVKAEISDTPNVTGQEIIDGSNEVTEQKDKDEFCAPDSQKLDQSSGKSFSDGKDDDSGKTSEKLDLQADKSIQEDEGTEGNKKQSALLSTAAIDNQKNKAEGQSTMIKEATNDTSKEKVKVEEMNIESAPKRALNLDNAKSDQEDIECEYEDDVKNKTEDVQEATTDSKLLVKDPEIDDNSKVEEKAEEQKIHGDNKPEVDAFNSKPDPPDEVVSKNEQKTQLITKTNTLSKQDDQDTANDPQNITSKRSADSEASCTSPPQKAKIDDGDVSEEKKNSIFGNIHESKAFLAVVSSKSCSYEWLNVNPDRDKLTRSSSRSPVSSPVTHPPNAYGSYPYYNQPHPQQAAGAYYAPQQYDYNRWGSYGYPPAQPYAMPQANPHWGYYPYYEHEGNQFPQSEHSNTHFVPTQHHGNYDHGHPSSHDPNQYSESTHPQYYSHPLSSLTQHNQYTQQEISSHDARYQQRPQDQYESEAHRSGSHDQTYSEGTLNAHSRPQNEHQAPQSPRSQGAYYYRSHPDNAPDGDGGNQWQR